MWEGMRGYGRVREGMERYRRVWEGTGGCGKAQEVTKEKGCNQCCSLHEYGSCADDKEGQNG